MIRPTGAVVEGSAAILDQSAAGQILAANLLAEWPIGDHLVGLSRADAATGNTKNPYGAKVSGHAVTGWLLVVGTRRGDDTWNGLTKTELDRLRSTIDDLKDAAATRPAPVNPANKTPTDTSSAPPQLSTPPEPIASIVAAIEARSHARRRR